MPLPFAPKPDESRVYDSLKDLLLTEVTGDQLDSLRGSVYAQGTNGAEDEYRRLLLLALASNQYGFGPMPGTSQIARVTSLNTTSVEAFKPDAGEVWQLFAGQVTSVGGGTAIQSRLYDGANYVMVSRDTSSTNEIELNEPVFVTNDLYLTCKTEAASGTGAISYCLIRVR